MTDPVQPEPQGERLGVPAAQAGLSPSVEPLRVSPPVGASIPNAEDIRRVALLLEPKDFEPFIRKAADDFYDRVLASCEDYLRENVEWNIASELAMLKRENKRMRAELHDVDSIVGPPWLTAGTRIELLREMDAARAELVALKYSIAFPAKAIEARRAETQSGSVHESAGRQASPNPPHNPGIPNHG